MQIHSVLLTMKARNLLPFNLNDIKVLTPGSTCINWPASWQGEPFVLGPRSPFYFFYLFGVGVNYTLGFVLLLPTKSKETSLSFYFAYRRDRFMSFPKASV